MRIVTESSRFKKDLKRVLKRGVDREKLIYVVDHLVKGVPLSKYCVPHLLQGEFRGVTECHITSDWLLLYEVTNDCVYLYRTGSHADLFDY